MASSAPGTAPLTGAEAPFLPPATATSRSKNETSASGSSLVAIGCGPMPIPASLPARPDFVSLPLALTAFAADADLLDVELDAVALDAVPVLTAPVAGFFPAPTLFVADFLRSPRALLPTPSTSLWIDC